MDLKRCNLNKLFTPRTVAVIGASSEPAKIGGRPLAYALKHGNQSKIYAVNPSVEGGELQGFPCYSSVGKIPDDIDLALIALPARLVLDAVRQCIAKNIPFGIIFSSGFGEMGEDGKVLEGEIIETARRGGMRLIGPNCQGIINLQEGIIASFTPALAIQQMIPGSMGLVSQSGAFAGSIFNFAQQRQIGLSCWVSIGNQADLNVWDCFDYMIEDKYTRVMGGYIEGIKDGSKMMDVAERALEAGKPIVLLKGGISERGASAALSHTGSIAGSATVARAAFSQKGIIQVSGVEELFDLATIFSSVQIPARDGIGVLTTSGAAGVLITDRCDEYGLSLAPLTTETKEKLGEVLPDFGSIANPVDLTAQMINQPEIFTNALDIFLADETIGLVIIMFTMVTENLAEICAAKLAETVPNSKKPVVVCWMATGLADKQIDIIRQRNIPVFETPYRCVRAVNALIKYHRDLAGNVNNKKGQDVNESAFYSIEETVREQIITTAKNNAWPVEGGLRVLTEMETHAILNANGIHTPRGGVAIEEQEAVELADEIEYPVVLKIESPDILHRSDAGAVRLGLQTPFEIRKAYNEIMSNSRQYNPQARLSGVSVQQMLPKETVECLLGTVHDPDFGWAIMFGLGGIFVEVLRDVSTRVVPLTRHDAESMVREIKGYKILKGARGRQESDIEELVNTILKLSRLLEEQGDIIAELEINPLFVLPKDNGVIAADCLMVLK